MDMLYKFGPAVISLRDFSVNNLFAMWHWRLDQFKTDAHLSPNLQVNLNPLNSVITPTGTISNEEKSGFFCKKVFKLENGDMLWTLTEKSTGKNMLSCTVSGDYQNIQLLEDNTDTAGTAAFEYLSKIFLYAAIKRDVLSFHGVLMEYKGSGIIIAAPSETGKSTHARMWRDTKNALIINGDNACCYKKDSVWTGFGIPWCGTSGEAINRHVPVKALVILKRGTRNTAQRLSQYDGFTECFPLTHRPQWDKALTEASVDLLNDFITETPVIELTCLPDEESVNVLENALEGII